MTAVDPVNSLSFVHPTRQQPLGHLPVAGRPRHPLPGPPGALGRDAEAPEARADRRRADRAGQRHGRPLRGLSRAAQPDPRPRQGRRALPPRRDARRGDGAVGLDDGQERRRQPALRRRQGRHPRRPEDAVAEGAGAHDAPLHQRDRHHHRPAAGHPGARRQHQRPDHGLDDGHLLDEHRRPPPPASSPASRSTWAARWAASRPPAAASSSPAARRRGA